VLEELVVPEAMVALVQQLVQQVLQVLQVQAGLLVTLEV
jgi:hypothetical protein